MRNIKIAIIQPNIIFGKKELNLKKISQMCKSLPKNLDLICLPEYFSTGFSSKIGSEMAEPIDGTIMNFLSNLAKKAKSNLVGGSFIEIKNGNFFNTSPVFDREGDLVGVYRKIHLFSMNNEIDFFSAGNKLPLFKLDFSPIGVLICYDLRFPEVSRLLTVKGVKFLIFPSNFPNPRYLHWKTLLTARALENQLYTVGINRVGRDYDNSYFGHSLIADPWGEIAFEALDEEKVFQEELSLVKIDKIRSFLTCLNDRRPDLYPD